MKGFLIFDRQSGMPIHYKDYTSTCFGLNQPREISFDPSQPHSQLETPNDYTPEPIGGAGIPLTPDRLAGMMSSAMAIAQSMIADVGQNVNVMQTDNLEEQTQLMLKSFQSESVSMIFKYESDPIKLALIFFYERSGFNDDTAELLATNIIKQFIQKYRQRIEKKVIKFKSFDRPLLTMYESALREWLTKLWTDFYSRGAIFTWFHAQFINEMTELEENKHPQDLDAILSPREKVKVNSDEEGDYTPFRRLPRLKKLPKKSKVGKGQISQDNVMVSQAQIRYGILYNFEVDMSDVTQIDITREEESKGSKDISSHSSRGVIGGVRRTLDEEKKEPPSLVGATGTPNQSFPVVMEGRGFHDHHRGASESSLNTIGEPQIQDNLDPQQLEGNLSMSQKNDQKIKEKDLLIELYEQVKRGKTRVKFNEEYQKQILNLIDGAQKLLNMKIMKMKQSENKEKESFEMLEMSLDKLGVLIDKNKMVVMKMNDVIISLGLNIFNSKLRLKNILINEKQNFKKLKRFISFIMQQRYALNMLNEDEDEED